MSVRHSLAPKLKRRPIAPFQRSGRVVLTPPGGLGASLLTVTVMLAAILSAMPFAQAAPAPDFTLKDLDGVSTTLRQQRGRVVVLNFWATWCPPCRTEIPTLMKLQATYSPGRAVVLGVAMDEEGAAMVAPFVARERFALNGAKTPLNYPVLIATVPVADAYRVEGLPMTVIIDGRGRVVRRIEAAIEHEDIDRTIRALLANQRGK